MNLVSFGETSCLTINQLKKKTLVFTHIVLLHFLICVFKKGKILHLLKYVVTIDSSGQNLSVFFYKKDKGDSTMAIGKAD